VALEYILATLAQLRAILLQTLLNRVVVAQLLPAKSLCVSRARLLLLRGAHMALSQWRWRSDQKRDGGEH
jgi:hypothetical protein